MTLPAPVPPPQGTNQPAIKNIVAERLDKNVWGQGDDRKRLDQLADRALGYAQQSSDWYNQRKKLKRFWGFTLRLTGVVLAAAAGIVPMVAQLMAMAAQSQSGPVQIHSVWAQPVWASLLLATAVALTAIDRFCGFSTGWMRYVQAATAIGKVRQDFEFDWQVLMASLGATTPTSEQSQHAITLIKGFVDQVNGIIGDETSKWIADFQQALQQADQEIRTAASQPTAGSVMVTVVNGAAVDMPGWTMSIDNANPKPYTGTTAGAIGLVIGPHVIRVSGTIGGAAKVAEGIANVTSGTPASVSLTLT